MKSATQRRKDNGETMGQWMAEEMTAAGDLLVQKLDDATDYMNKEAARFKDVCDRFQTAHYTEGADLQGMAFDVVTALGRLHTRLIDVVDAVEVATDAVDYVRQHIEWPHPKPWKA